MQDLKQQVQALGTEDWQAFLGWVVGEERDRRAAQPAVEQARAEDTQKLWEAHPELKPAFKTEEDVPQSGGALTLEDLLAQYDQWVQPLGAHDALPTGAIVAHKRRIWRTDLPTLNVWEPEAGNPHTRWVDITNQLLAQGDKEGQDTPNAEAEGDVPEPEPAVPEYKQPTGGHDAYKIGDRVTYQGAVYESTINGNVWTPDAYPQGWKKI